MGKFFQRSVDRGKSSFKLFVLEFLDLKSTRIQIVISTFLAWLSGIVYFGMIVPIVREISIIYYRQNSMKAEAVNLDSPHGSTVLGMLGAAFLSAVVGYITSNMATYKQQDPNYSLKKKEELMKVEQAGKDDEP